MLLFFGAQDATSTPTYIAATATIFGPGAISKATPNLISVVGSIGSVGVSAGNAPMVTTIYAQATMGMVLQAINARAIVENAIVFSKSMPAALYMTTTFYSVAEAYVYPAPPPNPVIRSERFQQPQLTRWRNRYRGARESYKVNIEMDQIRYDLARLQKVLLDNAGHSISDALNLYDGGFSSDTYTWKNTGSTLNAAPEGLFSMSLRVQKAMARLEILEIENAL